eukprot:TRINITY_DN12652_c0_g1_i1.p1 TRINITY_DN12652_c0_g1~~TRINITY_DN12652_c0_g1_i1.p1  ORF type:complete len:185 (+),score=37.48 TRINITY_DN12652_c0_g1_i1:41-595(+)
MKVLAVLCIFAVVLVSVVVGQSGFKQCQEPAVQPNFIPSKYLGKWYEITKLPFSIEQGDCISANYSIRGDGHIKVYNCERPNGGNSHECATGDATIVSNAKLAVTFGFDPISAPYWVIETDYSQYALVFSCVNILGYRFEYAWILSRTRTIPESLTNRLLDKFQSIGVEKSAFIPTNQLGCPAH